MIDKTKKDMSVLKTTAKFADAVKNNLSDADLKDYSGHGVPVHLRWNLNAAAKRDKIFAITVGDKTAFLDLEELLSYTRLM